MPQPTQNSWPFIMKESPSASGQTGGVVAGVGAAEGEVVGDKFPDAGILDAGALGVMIAEPPMLLDGLEVPGTGAPDITGDIDVGALNGLPLEIGDNGISPIEPGVLGVETATGDDVVDRGVGAAALL